MSKFSFLDIEQLKNINERRVWDQIAQYLENNSDDKDICTCSICLIDIAAITLNNIPSNYQVLDMIQRDNISHNVTDLAIMRQIKVAIEKVKAAPHH